MSEVSDRFVVVLDANVLYPVRVRDTLLRFAEAGLYRARWSSDILGEWTRSLLSRKPGLEENIRSQLKQMAAAFPEAMVDDYEDLIPTIALPDENDRHVLAVAIRAGAQLIVTENLKDFPAETLSQYGIEAMSADDFLLSTLELYPGEALSALRRMRRDYQNPSMTPDQFLTELLRVGLPKTVSVVRRDMDMLLRRSETLRGQGF